jgi:hypothetical protein
MTFDEVSTIPAPDKNTQTAARHCWEVACDLLYAAENGIACDERLMRDFAARLVEGVYDRYSSKVSA